MENVETRRSRIPKMSCDEMLLVTRANNSGCVIYNKST